jgi:hypothetical protein
MQVVGMFHWDGVAHLVVKVMDQDVISDDCNGIAVISYVARDTLLREVVVWSFGGLCTHSENGKGWVASACASGHVIYSLARFIFG